MSGTATYALPGVSAAATAAPDLIEKLGATESEATTDLDALARVFESDADLPPWDPMDQVLGDATVQEALGAGSAELDEWRRTL